MSGDEGRDLAKAASADELGFASEPAALGVGEAPGFAAELLEQNAIFFLEVFDDGLLVSVHPAGHGNEEELELSCHGVSKHSKVLAAQSFRRLRLIFLAVQAPPTGMLLFLTNPNTEVSSWCAKTTWGQKRRSEPSDCNRER